MFKKFMAWLKRKPSKMIAKEFDEATALTYERNIHKQLMSGTQIQHVKKPKMLKLKGFLDAEKVHYDK